MGIDWCYQVKCWTPTTGECVDYYKNAQGRYCGLPCFDDADEAVRHLAQLGIRGGVLRRQRYSPNATDGWYWLTANDATEGSAGLSDSPDNPCRWTGPRREECPDHVGLSADRDEYGRPVGWCWTCWIRQETRRLRGALETLESALTDHIENKIEAGPADWAVWLSEVQAALRPETEASRVTPERKING